MRATRALRARTERLAVAASVVLAHLAGAEPIPLETRAISRAHPTMLSSTSSSFSGVDDLQAISADGRFGVFRTWSQNLLFGFTVQAGDIVLFDRSDGALRPITRDIQDQTLGADRAPFGAAISADGSTIVYYSKAANLTPGENGDHWQVYATNRLTELTVLVSRGVNTSGTGAAGDSVALGVSGDGRFVLFQSNAQDLVAGYQGFGTHLFVFDAETYQTTLVDRSHLLRVRPASEFVGSSSMSRDGRWIAFTSTASDLIRGFSPAEGHEQLYLFDRETQSVRLVSHAFGAPTSGASGRSTSPKVSADGSLVVFTSLASNLLPTNPGAAEQVYAASTAGGPVRLVSTSYASNEVGADFGANGPSVDADGSRIAFSSPATNLLPETLATSVPQVYLFEYPRGSRTLVSRDWMDSGLPGNAGSGMAVVSDEGEVLLFSSTATNLVQGFSGPESANQLFVFDRSNGSNRLLTFRAGTTVEGCNGGPGFHALSADGSAAFFSSESDDLVVPDENRSADVFHTSTIAIDRVLVSARHPQLLDSRTSNGMSRIRPVGILSEDGRFSLFSSRATDLVLAPPTTVGRPSLFFYDAETDDVDLVAEDLWGRPTDPSEREGSPAALAGESEYVDRRIMASDGSAVVFADYAPPPSALVQAFAFDRFTRESTMMSHRFDDPSVPANDHVEVELISAGGGFAVLASRATDLIDQYSGAGRQLYLYDRATRSARLISHRPGLQNQGATGDSFAAGSSADGRWVTFWSDATDLIGGYVGPPGQAYLFDAATGSIRLISSVLGEPLHGSVGGGSPVSMSNDGRFVAFHSRGQDIVGSPHPLVDSQAFVWDRVNSVSVLASHAADDPLASSNANAWQTRISRDGHYVFFGSYATDLVPAYQGQGHQIYRFDRQTGETQLISHSASGTSIGSKYGAGPFATSADGQRVALISASPDLVAPPIPGDFHVYLYDAATDEHTLVSRSIQDWPIPTPGDYLHVDLSADGRAVAFDYGSDNLVERDWNFVWGGWDAYLALESPPWQIFRDGFASGDTSRWSVVAGGG